LFSANIENTIFNNTFKDLRYCAFINFNSYKLNTLGLPANECRGIKFPPDLLKNNVNLTSISGLFQGMVIETGVDINSDLLVNNTKLVDISGLFRNSKFSEYEYYESTVGNYSQISPLLFSTNSELQNVSFLFSVDKPDDVDKGLLVVEASLFGVTDG